MNFNIKEKRVYQIMKLDKYFDGWHNDLVPAHVDIFPWHGAAGDYHPVTKARIAVCEDSLMVFMETSETGTRAEETDFSRQVHTDSCMEFFLMPDPENSAQYINWEFNPARAVCLCIGTHRYDRHEIRLENYREYFQVKTITHNDGWSLEYCIPLAFLRSCFPALELKKGHVMRGNFYKCGDKTARPHFGCWSPIDLPKPDFQCPGFFGDLIIN